MAKRWQPFLEASPPPPPPLMPAVAVTATRRPIGYMVEFSVAGELVLRVWRAEQPSADDLLALQLAASTGIAARGYCTIEVLAADISAFFAGTAPPPSPTPTTPEVA